MRLKHMYNCALPCRVAEAGTTYPVVASKHLSICLSSGGLSQA